MKQPDNMDVDVLGEKFNYIFTLPEGDDVLRDLCNFCHILGTTYSPERLDMVFREGQRSVAMYILQRMKTQPYEIIKEEEF